MKVSQFSKPITAKGLNESMEQRFGAKVNIDSFSTEQLMDARNKLRTKIQDIETNESFDAVNNDEYQKQSMFLKVINQAIEERENIIESDVDSKDAVTEGAEEEATLVMAAKDMVDRVTGWMEDTAEMQSESMLELADAIRDEMGAEASETFTSTIKPALESMYTAMEATRISLTQGVGQLTGEGEPMPDMGAEEDPAMEPTVDADAEADVDMGDEPADDTAVDAATAGGEEEAGRETRESVERSRKLGTILSKKK